jgi:hypothetical protein
MARVDDPIPIEPGRLTEMGQRILMSFQIRVN